MIKAFSSWFSKNLSYLSHLFGITGIILILFLGLFYIPGRIAAAQSDRMRQAQQEVEQSVKELIFSDTASNIREIKFLIEAKEIQLGEKFPLSIPQVLTLAQQSFMQDKFLPLTERKAYIQELEDLKAAVPKAMATAPRAGARFWTAATIGTLLSIILSILLAALGAVTLIKKQRRETELQEELQNETAPTEIALAVQKHYAYEMENHFIAVLRTIEGVHIIEHPSSINTGVNVHFVYKNKAYFVKFKLLANSKVSLSTMKQLFYFVGEQKGEIWLIYNTNLTTLARQEIKELNQKSFDRICRSIKVSTGDEFDKILRQYLL